MRYEKNDGMTQAMCLVVLGAAIGVVVLFAATPVWAAGFDCDKANTPTEKTICATPGISSLDGQLLKDYRHALDVVADKEALIAAQRSWLLERNHCGDDGGCILTAYQKRLKELRLCDMRPTEIERYICNQNRLWGLDRTVEREYQQALQNADDKETMVNVHRLWLGERDRCGQDLFCLLNSYQKRLWILRGKYYPLTKDIPERPYVLEKGQGIEVCEAYQDNLNSQHPKGPWKCDRPINKALPGFEEQPNWRRDNTMPNGNSVFELYNQMGQLLWERDVNHVIYHTVSEWPNWLGTSEQLENSRKIFEKDRQSLSIFYPPYIATVDIDNDGTPEPVYFEQPCGSSFGSRLAVVTPNWKAIDREKTERLMPHPSFNRTGRDVFRPLFENEDWDASAKEYGYKPISDAWHNLYYDAFLYKDEAYIDQWWSRHPDVKGETSQQAGRLRVFQATPDSTRELCIFRYSE